MTKWLHALADECRIKRNLSPYAPCWSARPICRSALISMQGLQGDQLLRVLDMSERVKTSVFRVFNTEQWYQQDKRGGKALYPFIINIRSLFWFIHHGDFFYFLSHSATVELFLANVLKESTEKKNYVNLKIINFIEKSYVREIKCTLCFVYSMFCFFCKTKGIFLPASSTFSFECFRRSDRSNPKLWSGNLIQVLHLDITHDGTNLKIWNA